MSARVRQRPQYASVDSHAHTASRWMRRGVVVEFVVSFAICVFCASAGAVSVAGRSDREPVARACDRLDG